MAITAGFRPGVCPASALSYTALRIPPPCSVWARAQPWTARDVVCKRRCSANSGRGLGWCAVSWELFSDRGGGKHRRGSWPVRAVHQQAAAHGGLSGGVLVCARCVRVFACVRGRRAFGSGGARAPAVACMGRWLGWCGRGGHPVAFHPCARMCVCACVRWRVWMAAPPSLPPPPVEDVDGDGLKDLVWSVFFSDLESLAATVSPSITSPTLAWADSRLATPPGVFLGPTAVRTATPATEVADAFVVRGQVCALVCVCACVRVCVCPCECECECGFAGTGGGVKWPRPWPWRV